jgi:NAD-dependent histone deacetylase SIR2
MFSRGKSDLFKPSPFHELLDKLAREGRLLYHITQNIDCAERPLPDLNAKTIRLHGQVDQMRCEICSGVSNFEPQLFQGAILPLCQVCVQRNQVRTSNGLREVNIGKLKPDVLLYGNPHPDETQILEAVKDSLKKGPEIVFVVGTKLRIPGTLSIARGLCNASRNRGGVTVWISMEEPSSKLRSLFDYIFQGDCDAFALSVAV